MKKKTKLPEFIFRQVPFSLWKQILTEGAYETFLYWFRGQTVGVSEDGKEGCPYPWDVSRWIYQGCKKEQGPDWD
jgi:hypothetical protein